MVKPKKNDHLHSVDNFTVALKLQRVPRKHFQFSINIFVVSYRYIHFWESCFFFHLFYFACVLFWQIVYVAPMKALAAEMTANFGNKLQPLGIVVRELTGDMQLTKKEIQETQVQCKDSMSSTQPINFYLNFPGRLAQLLVVFPVEKCVLKSQQ